MKVTGQSQLKKEIEETKHVRNKTIDMKALHRNEQTHETEDGGFFCQSKLKVSTMNISRRGSVGEELSVTNDSPRLQKKETPVKKSMNYNINEYLAKHLTGKELF